MCPEPPVYILMPSNKLGEDQENTRLALTLTMSLNSNRPERRSALSPSISAFTVAEHLYTEKRNKQITKTLDSKQIY